MPNDEQESDRMDVFHEMMLNVYEGKLHLAPIGDHPQRILDIGTGTGIWAIDMGMIRPFATLGEAD
jgi:methylase of polypeptide subunit release factors